MTNGRSALRTSVLVLAAVVAIPVLAMALGVSTMAIGGWGHMAAGTGAWGGAIPAVLPLLVLVGLGYVLYAGLNEGDSRRTDGALEELEVAYARGELSDEEFERRRERLREGE
ncbi:SHOCT domain-containing protein [Salinilacihabitans rarus]|uniref:SHOCT domain-containing protein n=1 Tax=Salinilacihabitans rarus TaxID=2961596 RepID=UPI0020C92D6B|nr:SHOCT domain-containing protein [Salinilacihabitans rarus]